MVALVAKQLADRLSRIIGRRRIVVISDKYPPNTHGGAELSLHILLSALERKDDVLVVTFARGQLLPKTYGIDGVRVVSVPLEGAQPFERLAPMFRRAARGLLGAEGGHRGDEELVERVAASGPVGGPVADFVDYPRGAAVQAVRTILERCRPELVHADNYRSILIAALASRGLDVGRVALVRDNRFHCVRHDQSVNIRGVPCAGCGLECASEDLPADPALQRRMLERSRALRQRCLRDMDRVIVTSAYLQEQIGAIVPPDHVVRIANAPEEYEDVVGHMRGVAERPGTNVLVVGMLNENKGQVPLVRRLAKVCERIPDAVFHFAGRGARIERRIREIAADKGVLDRVVLHGYVDRARLYELYRECQIVALPTVWPEPFGRVPLEAGLARRPVVAFAVGGLRESVVDGETGMLVAPGDYDRFVDKLGVLADDPGRRLAMGRRGFDHVVRTYEVDELTDKLLGVWKGLIGGAVE